ncbi:DUF4349 domain-containing protein [Butyrivibrio sp. WCD2001]|uniref:DUF4349 domain-containing protein n=1 Tax=Butyrivibrio sp. WCD2001 TaxID=1280681 RepID=UPI00041D56EA|nr:DUF4349 domain-containing protein [Butyrivibrio sp. WCD2001]
MKRKSFYKIRFLTGAVILTFAVTGCGSSSNYASKSAESAGNYAMEEAADGALYEADYDMEVAEAMEESGSSNAETVTEEKASKKSNRKLITNMSMTTETKEFDKTIDFLKNRTDEVGGYVESFSTSKSNYSDERTANMTLRIPEEKLSGFVNEVAKESNIVSQDMNVTDVTLTYADLESHRNALRAEEEQLLTLMERADTIEDIMSIQDKLTDVRYQLESMESQLRTYDNQISYSTLRVTVREVIDYTPEPVKNPTFFERARDGFIENCYDVADFFKELALLIITHLITIIILAIIIVIIIILIRKSEKKRKERLSKMTPAERTALPGMGAYTYGPKPEQADNNTTDKTDKTSENTDNNESDK